MTTQQTLQTEEYKQTELGELPKEWKVALLGDVADVFDKQRIPLSVDVRAKKQGIYPYCGANGIIDYINEFIFDGEFVLLAEDGGYWGPGKNSSYIMNGKFWVNNHAHILKAISEKTINKFLFYALNHIDMNPLIGGDARGKLTQTIMRTVKIPFPPLPEQQKIASVLSTVQTAQEKTQNFINSLKELKKSAMKHLFTYGAVSFEDIDKVELKEIEIGMMPLSWEETKVKVYCKQILTGGTPKTDIKEYYEPQEIPWMKSGEIQGSRITKIDTYISKKGLDNSNARILPKNSVVIALAGRGKTRGTTAILEMECTCNQSVVCMVPNDKLSYEFLHYYLSNIYFYIRNLTGDKDRTGLNKEIIGNFPLNLPSLPEQQKIASILSAIDEKILAEEQKKEALKETFNSLLKNLMTAKIRVNNLERF